MEKVSMLMAQHKIGCLPVIDGDDLVGMVTTTDVLSHFAGVQLR
jgi:acetoin utilization protein AcuB